MKKIFSIILILALVFALAACGGETPAAKDDNAEQISISQDADANTATETDNSNLPSESEEPPAKPLGEPPEKPNGEPPEKPSGDAAPSGGGNAPGHADVVYAGNTVIDAGATERQMQYASETADESALMIDTADDVVILDFALTKTGDSDGGDNCSFYGQNAALLVKGGSFADIERGSIESNAKGANGVFCYGGNGGRNGAEGDGTTAIVRDVVINTTGDGSGGVMVTGGGYMEADNLTIETQGRSSAPIRSDRGGGTMVVNGGAYTSNGLGSPAIYSTANIAVYDAELVSNLSEGVCIEGLNSIALYNTNLTANNTQRNGNASFCDTVMMYQSMSGDAASGTSAFIMSGGTLTSKNGHVFHVTNTHAVINLFGVQIINEDTSNILLSVCDDGWSGGVNAATLNADGQQLTGTILVGNNSQFTLNLDRNSSFEGSFSGNIENASGEIVSSEIGEVSVKIDGDSTWKLTGDSYISEFEGDIASVDFNGHTLYVNGEAIA